MSESNGPIRTRSLIGYLAVAVLVVGVLLAAGGAAQAQPQPPYRAGVMAHGQPMPMYQSIPGAAFLQPSDLGGAATGSAPTDLTPYLRPPQPSSTARYPNAALRADAGAISAMYGIDGRPTVLLEYLAIYHGNGAAQYLGALRTAVSAPGGRHDPTGYWSLLASGTAGPDSLLIRLRQTTGYEGSTVEKDSYLVVARTGRIIVVLADLGWETGSGHRSLVEQFGTTALARVVAATSRQPATNQPATNWPACPGWRR